MFRSPKEIQFYQYFIPEALRYKLDEEGNVQPTLFLKLCHLIFSGLNTFKEEKLAPFYEKVKQVASVRTEQSLHAFFTNLKYTGVSIKDITTLQPQLFKETEATINIPRVFSRTKTDVKPVVLLSEYQQSPTLIQTDQTVVKEHKEIVNNRRLVSSNYIYRDKGESFFVITDDHLVILGKDNVWQEEES